MKGAHARQIRNSHGRFIRRLRKADYTVARPLFTARTQLELRTNTLDLIDEKYNNAEWTHVYTDGSATEAVKDGGSGIFIKYPSGNAKRISIPAGHTCSNYKAEPLAIQKALDSLEDLELNKRNIALFTDSVSALQGLDSDRDDIPLLKIKQSLSKLGEERNVVLQWIPAHWGIPGNEEADKLSKIGSETNDDQPSSLTYAEVKTIVKTKWNNDWKKNHLDYSMEKDACTAWRGSIRR